MRDQAVVGVSVGGEVVNTHAESDILSNVKYFLGPSQLLLCKHVG